MVVLFYVVVDVVVVVEVVFVVGCVDLCYGVYV